MNHVHRLSLHLLLHLQQQKRNEGGYSLVVTLASIILLGTLLVTAALVSKVDTSSTNASTDSNSGFYAAEAGLHLRANNIRNEFNDFNRPAGTEPAAWEDCIDGDSSNNGSDTFECESNLTINNQQIVTFVDDVTEASEISIQIQDGPFAGLNAQEYRYDLMSVALDSEGGQNSPSSILGMRFKTRLVPLFQFAAFYDGDLDFTYPPSMTLRGRMHSNNDLYLNASGSGTLSILGKVTSAGTLYRGVKVEDSCGGTVNIDIDTNKDNGNELAMNCSGSGRTAFSTASDVSAWNNRIELGIDPLKLPEIEDFNPDAGNTYWDDADLRIVLKLDGVTGSATYNMPLGIEIRNADNSVDSTLTDKLLNQCPVDEFTLQNDNDGTPTIYEAGDTNLYLNSVGTLQEQDVVTVGSDIDSNVIRSGGVDSSNDSIRIRRALGHLSTDTIAAGVKVRSAVVSTSDTFYNYREKDGATGVDAGKYIRMLNVDVQKLLDCAGSNSQNLMGKALSDDTDGGLVWFFTVDGPLSDNDVRDGDNPNNYGIRLYNGSSLSSSISGAPEIKGLTVVSDQAIYIQGDYNSSNWKPAAIMADTINVLSNAWKMDDSDGRYYSGELPSSTVALTDSRRDASNTSVIAAFLGGVEISGGVNQGGQDLGYSNSFSGGLHNFPRLHEDWNGSTLTYRGSIVSLYQPRRVNGPFCGSGGTGPTCNIYNPPTRNWSFEELFEQAQNLPPLTPRALYVTQEIFERDFTYRSSSPTYLNLSALFSTDLVSKTNTFQPFLTAFNF